MRDNSGRIILALAMVILVLTAGGLWLLLNRDAAPSAGLVGRLIGGDVTVLDSEPDPAFGSGGAARIEGPAILAPAALLVDDAAVYMVATAAEDPGDEHFAVARLDLAGRMDGGYGRQGLVELDFGGGDQVARGGLLQPDGKLLVFGHASAGGTRRNMVVARLLADGSPDPAFDDDGLTAIRFGDGIQSAEAAGLDAAGRLTLAGYAVQLIAGETYREMAFARLLPDGSLDPSFGTGGLLRDRMRLEVTDQSLAAVLVAPSGELRGAGSALMAGDAERRPVLGQWLSPGVRDSSFGLRGMADLAVETGQLLTLADAGGGLTLAAGTAAADGRGVFLLRLLPNGMPDRDFGDDGLLRIGADEQAPLVGLRVWPLGAQLLLLSDDGVNFSSSVLTASGVRLPGMTRRLVLGPRAGPAAAALAGSRLWTAHAEGGDPSPVVVRRFDLAGGVAGGR